MTSELLSKLGANAATNNISWFCSAFNPIATQMEHELTADDIIQRVAPVAGPMLVSGKTRVRYFVPTLLKYALFVATTADKRPGQSGFQRSASHVVSSAWFPFDLDGLTTEQWERILAALDALGAKFVAYSSYGYGAENKPGIRARLLLFMDRSLNPLDWKRTWGTVNERLLFGLVDKQTGHLAQQAGVWATHPKRRDKAFRIEQPGALLSAETLLALVPVSVVHPKNRTLVKAPLQSGTIEPARINAALKWLDPRDYAGWMAVVLGLKAGVMLGHLSEEVGRTLWLAFSEGADESAKAKNDDSRYDPEVLWDKLEPSVAPREALLAGILARARDEAVRCVSEAIRQNRLTPESQHAAEYLGRYHRGVAQQIFQEPV